MNRRSSVSVHALEAVKSGSKEQIFNGRGEFNATSKRDLLMQIGSLLERVASEEITFDAASTQDNKKSPEFLKERFENFQNAYRAYDAGDARQWQDCGASMVGVLQTTMERAGFMRNQLIRGELIGDVPKFRRKDRSNVTAVVSNDFGGVAAKFVSDPIIEGMEVMISENVRVLNREINRGNIDLVEDVYLRAQQGIFLREDQLYMKQVRRAAGVSGQTTLTSSPVTPQLLGTMKSQIDSQAMPPAGIIIGTQVWPDFLSANFATAINPVTNYELVSTGRLGKILGLDITTDGFRPIGLRVLQPYELLMTAAPEYHGGYTDRGPVVASPRDNYDDGQPAKGWYMYEEISIIIANAASVSLLIRQ